MNNLISEEYEQLNGVPQRSLLYPTLLLIAINSITNNIELPVKTILYADDLNFYCCNLEIVENMLQNTTKNIIERSKTFGFNFSSEKSQCIVLTKKHKNASFSIKMGQQQIKE